LSFFGLRLLAIVMFVFLWFTAFATKERQTSQWSKAVNQRKTNITMAKSRKPKKDKHHNG
jgi:Na+/melibiose symporter-like transporter